MRAASYCNGCMAMQTRSIEMLETLRRSAKKFSEAEVMQFIRDVKDASHDELAAILNPPKPVRSPSKPKVPVDPFVKRLNDIKRGSGMKAADALAVLRELMSEHLPSVKVAAKTSFPALLKLLRAALTDEEVESAFQRAAADFRSRYSLRYDMS